MIEINNVIIGRKIAVTAVYLRNTVANQYEANKNNIIQYADRARKSFI